MRGRHNERASRRRMLPTHARSNASEMLLHIRSLAGFITIMCGFRFLVHTGAEIFEAHRSDPLRRRPEKATVRSNFAANALVHRAVVGARAQGWWRSTSSMSCRIHTIG
jgi:hypothetical protein